MRFVPGFRGRLGSGGIPPRCAICGSLERHRIVYVAFLACRPRLAGWRALHFAPDPSVDPRWFREYEASTYGGENSLDLLRIDRPDGRYELVVANHVLEHVSDDRRALSEMLRVVGPEGLVQITVPSPLSRLHTVAWNPDPARNGHFRYYGGDCALRMKEQVPDVKVLGVIGPDIITGTFHVIFFLSRSLPALQSFAEAFYEQDLILLRLA